MSKTQKDKLRKKKNYIVKTIAKQIEDGEEMTEEKSTDIAE